MEILIPDKVNKIIRTLSAAGHEAFAVGGCIRDSILLRTPKDWDITTSARPEEVKSLFRRTIDTGIEHGTVTVMDGSEGFEVTTYRIDGSYKDGRHPDQVTYTDSLAEDLRRRDFTINAMAYSEERGLVDPYGGRADLQAGIIRCVGAAGERFSEDALRIMRALRFCAQLHYRLEEETKRAVKELAHTLSRISEERIRAELVQILLSQNPGIMLEAYELGITRVILPEFNKMMETRQNNPHHCYSVGEHSVKSLCHVPPVRVLRLTMLLHDVGKPGKAFTDEQGIDHFYGHGELGEIIAVKILKRLKFDNTTIDQVGRLVRFHDCRPEPTLRSVRKLVYRVGEDIFPLLLKVQRADILAQSEYQRAQKLAYLDKLSAIYQEILANQDCLSLKDLAVTGRDLIAAGMKPGRELGEALKKLLELVLENPELNQKETLLRLVDQQQGIHPADSIS